MGQGAVDAWRKAKYQTKTLQPCAYCRKRLTYAQATVDHRTPKSRGGLDRPRNFYICCEPCNTRKKNMTEDEYRVALRTGLWPKVTRIGRGPTGPWEKRFAPRCVLSVSMRTAENRSR